MNLTRFSLFFPEKRDFFVENSGTFSFGDIGERNLRLGASLRDFSLFHSRRIGERQRVRLKAKIGFSTTLFASGFVQYNAAVDQVVTNLRLNYVHSPLSHLFIVYTERRGTLASGVRERAITAKITKLLAF